MKFYISFGQGHAHSVDGITYDKDALCLIEAPSELPARRQAIELFDREWSDIYYEKELPDLLRYFLRGVVNEGHPYHAHD